MNIKYINNPYYLHYYVGLRVKQTDTVLDIGSGIRPQNIIKPITHICCEPYKEYSDMLLSKMKRDSNLVVLNIGWQEAVQIFPANSVDTVILLDVIEHLEKEEGLKLLEKTIKIARKQVIIFTPYGFLPQEVPVGMKDAWGLDGAEWQKHKSGWLPKDFGNLWKFYVCKELHFTNVITGKRFEKPYGAMYAIFDKNNKGKINIYSVVRMLSGSIKKIKFLLGSISINRVLNSKLGFSIYHNNKFASHMYDKFFRKN